MADFFIPYIPSTPSYSCINKLLLSFSKQTQKICSWRKPRSELFGSNHASTLLLSLNCCRDSFKNSTHCVQTSVQLLKTEYHFRPGAKNTTQICHYCCNAKIFVQAMNLKIKCMFFLSFFATSQTFISQFLLTRDLLLI